MQLLRVTRCNTLMVPVHHIRSLRCNHSPLDELKQTEIHKSSLIALFQEFHAQFNRKRLLKRIKEPVHFWVAYEMTDVRILNIVGSGTAHTVIVYSAPPTEVSQTGEKWMEIYNLKWC